MNMIFEFSLAMAVASTGFFFLCRSLLKMNHTILEDEAEHHRLVSFSRYR